MLTFCVLPAFCPSYAVPWPVYAAPDIFGTPSPMCFACPCSLQELESVFGSMDPGTNRTASMGLCVHPSVGSLPEDALLTNSPNPSIVPNRSSPSSPCSPHVGPSLQIAVSSMKEVEEQITGLQYIGRGACGAVVKGM